MCLGARVAPPPSGPYTPLLDLPLIRINRSNGQRGETARVGPRVVEGMGLPLPSMRQFGAHLTEAKQCLIECVAHRC